MFHRYTLTFISFFILIFFFEASGNTNQKKDESDTRMQYGLGYDLTRKGFRIRFVLEQSPADLAGVSAGDFILKINDTSTENLSLKDVSKIFKNHDSGFIVLKSANNQEKNVFLRKEVLSSKTIKEPSFNILGYDVGDSVEDIQLIKFDSDSISLKSLTNKIVLIYFWATWCKPCLSKIPLLQEIFAKYKPYGLEIAGVSLDSKTENAKSYLKENHINWYQHYGENGLKSRVNQNWNVVVPGIAILQNGLQLISVNNKFDELDSVLYKFLLESEVPLKNSKNAAKYACYLANEYANEKYNVRPFLPNNFVAKKIGEQWQWGMFSPKGIDGFSAEIFVSSSLDSSKIAVFYSNDHKTGLK